MKLTNSAIKSYQRCRRQYHYKFVDRLVPRHTELPLKRGSWLHELLEAHYSGEGWKQRNDVLAKEYNALFEEEREMWGDLPTICAHIMRSYEYRWRDEDSGLKVIEVEKEFEVELPHNHIMQFKIDAIVEDEWGLWLMEHKTHKSFPKSEYRFMDMQTTKYVWGLQQLGYDITGVMWNYLLTVEPKKPKLTKLGKLSRAKIRTDAITFIEAIREYGLDVDDFKGDIIRLRDHNDFFRRERVPRPPQVAERLIKEAVATADEIERGFLPIRSIDRSCDMFCPYMDLCITSLYGGDTKGIERMKFQVATHKDYYGYADDKENA